MARSLPRAGAVGAPTAAEPGQVKPNYPELLARLPAIVYVADPGGAGRWHYVSAQIETILGYTPEEWRADPRLWAKSLHPNDRESVINTEARLVAGDAGPGPVEYRMLHRDGHVVWIRDDAVLVRDADGVERWHGVLSDITEQKRTEVELERIAAQQAAVARLGEHALEGARPLELMQEAVECAVRLLEVEVAAVLELIGEERCFVLRAGVGWPATALGTMRPALGSTSQAGYTILTRAPVVVEDWATEARFEQSAVLTQMNARSGASVMIDAPAAPFGVLGVQSSAPRSYSKGDLDFLQALANVLADALERQTIEERMRHRALHDPLTGLANRALFLDRLEHALSHLERRGGLGAILFLDLDHFKLINDKLGHQSGDQLLAAAGPRLRSAVRSSDTVARFGGDEFGILLEDISDERDAIEMAERLAGVFTQPFVLGGSEHFVTTSIGIALARGGEQATDLIREADSAMYRAKKRGSARYEVYDEAMRRRAILRLRVERDLRRALERDELRLEYQPVVSLRDAGMVAVEALVRWHHPDRGVIFPREFIPVAEEDGLIDPIGRWVTERACREVVSWNQAFPLSPPLSVSVNLAAAQFSKPGLPELIGELLGITGLDPGLLSLEVTEAVILRDAATVTATLRELKALGVRLVLDDFGTGYSPLSYLINLPLDALKIDHSFVNGIGGEDRDTAMSEAILGMSRALSLEVVAEGVETAQQASELARLGCEFAQGFHFSRPVPAAEISRMLEHGPPWERILVPLPSA